MYSVVYHQLCRRTTTAVSTITVSYLLKAHRHLFVICNLFFVDFESVIVLKSRDGIFSYELYQARIY
jgi:hypothetical protein